MKNKVASIYACIFAIVSARRRLPFLQQFGLLLIGLLFSVQVFARNPLLVDTIALSQLPVEARQTLVLIKQGGPFSYRKDGVVFGNYEGLLPKQKRGYYHEFTVKTPRARNRGARRLISGGTVNASSEYYYTDDHYASFKRVQE
ncbi:ribonuclease [Glaciimonas sp. Gout2]|uniref:ribonuclease n=1 Tax=unclassified Glaciimonas TaxID=2644401 RepID=UPI002AB3F9F9|nr:MULTISPECIES: ribonuclease [unclassified Glaciimonas]MDY7547540.1 ribonuclease [Glaciimonas sp. CA11.2]MEB0013508.1 ribonuclease [Glaciimonas sp. Cout2]MEB0081587.1 ribonuclease [Glaciimonas sp. Gout2]